MSENQFSAIPLLDSDQVLEVKLMDDEQKAFTRRLVFSWQETRDTTVKGMASAFEEKNWGVISKLAHRFKGSCSGIGALRLKHILECIEKESKRENIEQISTLWECAAAEMEETLADLKKAFSHLP